MIRFSGPDIWDFYKAICWSLWAKIQTHPEFFYRKADGISLLQNFSSIYLSTRCNILEDLVLYQHHCQNFKCRSVNLFKHEWTLEETFCRIEHSLLRQLE
jgi:hypothetical protein